MADQHFSPGVRISAIGVTFALAVTACSGSESNQEQSANDPTVMVTAALGTQAVQDFLIHLDLQVETADGFVSYYGEVLDGAAAGAGEPLTLTDGLTFTPVESLDGRMVDREGESLPSLEVDFGLLGLAPQEYETTRSRLADALRGAGYTDAGDQIAATDRADSLMLVELVTADYTRTRSHTSPGDRAAVDLTFVKAIAPGDKVTSVYLFGQSLPGDPESEAGLSPHELFAYRWNQGLITILGTDEGLTKAVDTGIDVVEGSTITLQEVKAVAASIMGAAVATRNLEEVLARPDGGIISRWDAGQTEEVNVWEGATGWIGLSKRSMYGPVAVRRPVLISYIAFLGAKKFCLSRLPAMLKRNRAEADAAAAARAVAESVTDSGSHLGQTIDEIVNGRDPEDPPVNQLCAKPEPPPGSVGGTFGDVHITTFDGWSYDNQAAGEFLVFDNGMTTVQMRLAPWEDSDAVSVVTAAAVGVGDHEVSMHQGGRIWIDGEKPHLERGKTIAVGDAALLWTGTGWFIVWPDGTEVRVTGGQRDLFADTETPTYSPLVVLIYPSDRPSVGMIGSPDGDGKNDWVTRSGEQLDSEIRFDFDNFYSTYVDTWRISQDESLFHYEPRESTDTFTVGGFPRVRYDLADLDPDVVADAAAACSEGGIERPEILENCTLDVALTGDYGFVLDAYVVESATAGASGPVPEPDAGPTSADGENVVTVGPLSVGFGADPPVVLPNSAVQWQCQAADGSLFATSRFQESQDSSYKVTIEYLDGATSGTGDERFSVIVEINGDPVAWMQTTTDPMTGSLDSVTLDGSTLVASGTALLNQPPDPTLYPGSAITPGTEFEPFLLHVDCPG